MQEKPDDTLIEEIRNGDTESFAVIVERYQTPVYNLMYRYSNSTEDAAEMSQELFCRVFGQLDRYRRETTFFAWLYTLALNQARDWSRKRIREGRNLRRFAHSQDHAGPESPEQILEARYAAGGLMEALTALPEDRREMVLLRYRHERSIREIADIFEISQSAVKMRLKRALGELADHLKN